MAKSFIVTPEHVYYDSVVELSSSEPDLPDGSTGENPFFWFSYGCDEPDAPVKYTAVVRVPGPVVREGALNPELHEIVGEKIAPEFNGRIVTIADTPGFDANLIVTIYEDEREFSALTAEAQDQAAEFPEVLHTRIHEKINTLLDQFFEKKAAL